MSEVIFRKARSGDPQIIQHINVQQIMGRIGSRTGWKHSFSFVATPENPRKAIGTHSNAGSDPPQQDPR